MSFKLLLTLLLSLSLFTVVSCGSDDDDDSGPNPPLLEEGPGGPIGSIRDFDTRLSPNLRISGQRCEGGETTNDPQHPTQTCDRDEWLVTVDNDNTCTADGICTEIFVFPFVAELDRQEEEDTTEFVYYEIEPESPVEQDERAALRTVWVRVNRLTGEANVVERN